MTTKTKLAKKAIDPFDTNYHNIPLWCVHGHEAHPAIHCLKLKMSPSSANFKLTVWGYSVYKGEPGFRTLGKSIEVFSAEKKLLLFFVNKQDALDYLSIILEPKVK